jgi:hypothetical protein
MVLKIGMLQHSCKQKVMVGVYLRFMI